MHSRAFSLLLKTPAYHILTTFEQIIACYPPRLGQASWKDPTENRDSAEGIFVVVHTTIYSFICWSEIRIFGEFLDEGVMCDELD